MILKVGRAEAEAIASIAMMIGTAIMVGFAALLFLPLLGVVGLGGLVLLYGLIVSAGQYPDGSVWLPMVLYPSALLLTVWIIVDGIPAINDPDIRSFLTLLLRSAALVAFSIYALKTF